MPGTTAYIQNSRSMVALDDGSDMFQVSTTGMYLASTVVFSDSGELILDSSFDIGQNIPFLYIN